MNTTFLGGKDPLVAECGRLQVDARARIATLGGDKLELEKPAFVILAGLALVAPKVVEYKRLRRLLAEVGIRRARQSVELSIQIAKIRDTLALVPDQVQIVNLPGVGYRLIWEGLESGVARQRNKPKAPTLQVVYIGGLRYCRSKVEPVCARIGGELIATYDPNEAVVAIAKGTFLRGVGLVIIQPLPGTSSLLRRIREYGVEAPTYLVGGSDGCWPPVGQLALNIKHALKKPSAIVA